MKITIMIAAACAVLAGDALAQTPRTTPARPASAGAVQPAPALQDFVNKIEVLPVREAVTAADLIAFALPDVPMSEIYQEHVAPALTTNQVLLFMHGFNIHFGFIQPPANVDVVMVSPKGAGYGVRSLYEQGNGVPALIAVKQNASGKAQQIALSYAWALGSARSVVLETTFQQETVSDLFGEHASPVQ